MPTDPEENGLVISLLHAVLSAISGHLDPRNTSIRDHPDVTPAQLEPLRWMEPAELLWRVLLTVGGKGWAQQTPEWQQRAARWYDLYFRIAHLQISDTETKQIAFHRLHEFCMHRPWCKLGDSHPECTCGLSQVEETVWQVFGLNVTDEEWAAEQRSSPAPRTPRYKGYPT